MENYSKTPAVQAPPWATRPEEDDTCERTRGGGEKRNKGNDMDASLDQFRRQRPVEGRLR